MINRRPNILWYCADQMRSDTIGALGNPYIRTPNLDAHVARGTAFENAYVQSPVCTPSRASFLTGRYPMSTRVYRNETVYFPPNETLVTKILADGGYRGGLVGKLHLNAAIRRQEQRVEDDGYDFFAYSHLPSSADHGVRNDYHTWLKEERGVDPEALFAKQMGFIAPGVPAELHQSTWCTDMAMRFIDESGNQPWFLSVNPFDPHPPFDPPQDYLDRYDPKAMPAPLFRESDLERQKMFENVSAQTTQAFDPTDTGTESDYSDQAERSYRPPPGYDGRAAKAAYYAMIELLDEQFGRLVEHLEQIGHLHNTIIIFMSDHGELLGDHGLMYKGGRFFESLVHVPMIISGPGYAVGQKSKALVELVDVAPTLLEAAGLEIPETMQGQSLVPILRQNGKVTTHKETVFCEYHDGVYYSQADQRTYATMTFDGRYKLVVYHTHDICELFDLEADPGEFTNLYYDGASDELRHKLIYRHMNRVANASDQGVARVIYV
ncbi:Arylsulfatase [Marinovum algicola]|uniref:Arylsulfatase A n=1 Tax=Marinovum algicola TaxID=42444 RepID=A0A975WFG7_9RHOB|nr:sulfatase-like hydrolase/transferase [Marinovum algicola]SEK11155.1 Arylsulfatase A [Marinovum algicola]SLN71246.1 Arylsulfatase [Marinovum algicola]